MNVTVIEALAAWRLTNLLVFEDGPFDIFAKLRLSLGVRYDERSVPYGTNVLSRGIICLWCCSVWVGALFAILTGNPVNFRKLLGMVFKALALSATTVLIDEALELGRRMQ